MSANKESPTMNNHKKPDPAVVWGYIFFILHITAMWGIVIYSAIKELQ